MSLKQPETLNVDQPSLEQQRERAQSWLTKERSILEDSLNRATNPHTVKNLTIQLAQLQSRETLLKWYGKSLTDMGKADRLNVERAFETLDRDITVADINEWAEEYLDYEARLSEQKAGK